MIEIETRQKKDGTWFCSATINGYDFAFHSKLFSVAQSQMFQKLIDENVPTSNIKWNPAVWHVTGTVTVKKESTPVRYSPFRIDKSPLA
jgi:hypothetical protein